MNRYKLIRVVGVGSFGQAFLCCDNQTHMNVIVKEVNISEQAPNVRESSLNEAKILSKLKNPNIVKFVESFIEKGKLYIVMEYAEGGDLWTYVQNRKGKLIPEKQILLWIQQLCSALNYIHSQNILHRDLKSKNIFLDAANNAKLGDFGIAKVLEHTGDFAKTIVGSPFYLSPEICNGVPYDEKTDIWSLGCVFYEMCTLTPAFSGKNMGNVVMKILLQKQQPIPRTYSKELSKLIDSMLQKEPSDRPSLTQILKMNLFKPQTPKPPAKVKVQISPPSHVLELNFQPEIKKRVAPAMSVRSSHPVMTPRRSRSPRRPSNDKISNCLVIQSLNSNACSKTASNSNHNVNQPIFKNNVNRSTRTTATQNLRKSTNRKMLDKNVRPKLNRKQTIPPKKKSSQAQIRTFLENKIGKSKMIKAYNDLKEEIIDEKDILDYIGGKGNEYLIVLLQRLIVMEDESEFICEKIL
ncbi:hypothetical protein M9Y10_027340 [Tritrichomonas musculus]|uniref:non-specific serine/threonine protein kinase n=1 Tax=Tritrichomonas musculus TaxID=1915356 RepID=A0ABR2H4N5_9EUKA